MPKKQSPPPTDNLDPDQPLSFHDTEEADDEKSDDESTVKKQSGKQSAAKSQPAATPTATVVRSSAPTAKRFPLWGWVVLGAVVVFGAAVGGWAMFGQPPRPVTNTSTPNRNVDRRVPRNLDGVLVPASQQNGNIFAVMIENIRESRPPSGLDKASVVYEALAEGGITRFLALFPVGVSVPEIGPVRSARPYFIAWAEEYKPLYVRAGGSPQALALLRAKPNIIDFNQFTNGPFFWRDKSRRAPHNLYTSSEKLFLGLKRTAPEAVPTYKPWTFKEEPALDSRPTTVNDVVIDFSSFAYKVTYRYDRALNQYQRLLGDAPHVTKDGTAIAAKNVVIEYVQTGLIPGDKQRLQLQTSGEGRLVLIQDGTVIEGTWKKVANADRTELLDANGNPLALNPGPIWIEIVPTDRKVTY